MFYTICPSYIPFLSFFSAPASILRRCLSDRWKYAAVSGIVLYSPSFNPYRYVSTICSRNGSCASLFNIFRTVIRRTASSPTGSLSRLSECFSQIGIPSSSTGLSSRYISSFPSFRTWHSKTVDAFLQRSTIAFLTSVNAYVENFMSDVGS